VGRYKKMELKHYQRTAVMFWETEHKNGGSKKFGTRKKMCSHSRRGGMGGAGRENLGERGAEDPLGASMLGVEFEGRAEIVL